MSLDLLSEVQMRRREAELRFAGAAFHQPDWAGEACGWLQPGALSDARVKSYWAAVQAGKDNIAAATESGILLDLINSGFDLPVYSPENMRSYGDDVANQVWFARIADKLPALANAIHNNELETARRLVTELGGLNPESSSDVPDSTDVGLQFIASLDEENQSIPYGINKLDNALGGLWRKTITVMCARPSIGKTAAGWQIARLAAFAGFRVLFVSLEMPSRDLWARAACGLLRVPYRDVMAKRISEEQKQALRDITTDLIDKLDGKLFVDDRPYHTSGLWQSVCSVRPDLLVVDHLRLFLDKNPSEVKRLGEITWALKRIAKEFDCAVLAMAQLNRQLESRQDKRPELSDLRDSGEIEENADVVLGIHRDRVYLEQPKEKSPAEILALKFRNGPANIRINLIFDGMGQWFEEPER